MSENNGVRFVETQDFPWTDDYSWLRHLTCRNHQDAKYYTKSWRDRALHVITLPAGEMERSVTGECICPASDLVVVVAPGSDEERDIKAHTCDTAKHLDFQGTYGAPGFGNAHRCRVCLAPWTQVGDVFFRPDLEDGEPSNILTPGDVI